jgi:2-methylisocitrate lyase-like PEP mutase family enzyme
MSQLLKEKRAKFRKLHETGCFVLPNPWDVGSARMLEHLGFVALASTSAGFAWSIGRPDYGLPRGKILAHLTELTQAVTPPSTPTSRPVSQTTRRALPKASA